MFRSLRAAIAKSRQAKAIANSRQLLLESLEQRRLLSASPGLALAPLNVTSPAAFYGPVQGGVGERAGINLRAEGEGESTPDTARQLLFAGIAGSTASPTNSGLLTIIDATPNSPTDTIVPWKAPVLSGGIAGLAFDLSGRLFAAVDQGPCTPSELVELNPADGTAIRRLPIMAARRRSTSAISRLSHRPASYLELGRSAMMRITQASYLSSTSIPARQHSSEIPARARAKGSRSLRTELSTWREQRAESRSCTRSIRPRRNHISATR